MRKITEQAKMAFNSNENFKKSNTEVHTDDFTTELYLHNNLIATKNRRTGVLKITNAGWESNTTKERLNSLPGVNIYQKDFVWYLNGKAWDGKLTKIS